MNNYSQEYYEPDAEVHSRKIGVVVGLVLVIAVVVAIVMILRAARPPFVPAPTSYVTFSAPDGTFKVDRPQGWSADNGESNGMSSYGVFKRGHAKIDVSSDLGGSLMADMAQAQNSQYENIGSMAEVKLPPPPPPIEKVHAAGKQDVMARYDHYVELPEKTLNSKIGDGRVSEFTADGSRFNGMLHGYRATMLSNDRRVVVIAVCPQVNWPTLQPAFMHVIESVDRGQQ